MRIALKTQENQKTHAYITAHSGLTAKPFKKPMHIALKTKKTQKIMHIATNGGPAEQPIKKPTHVALRTIAKKNMQYSK